MHTDEGWALTDQILDDLAACCFVAWTEWMQSSSVIEDSTGCAGSPYFRPNISMHLFPAEHNDPSNPKAENVEKAAYPDAPALGMYPTGKPPRPAS